MKKKDAEAWSNECPFDFSWHEALFCLYQLQQYEAMGERRYKYAQGIFYNKIFDTISGIQNSASRKTILNHLHDPRCVVCHTPVSIQGKVLDHIIPKSLTGPNNLENMMVLCPIHNSSKGKKDLIEWWTDKEWSIMDLPRNILCLYCRLMWQHLDQLFKDPYDLPDYIRIFITERAIDLPSDEHRVALYGSTYAGIGFIGWERMHESEGLL